ncbi:MAG TPA: MarR family transcriptional regulator [Stellaceae bacterium]|nr:MarR family transcriptional regulator [Stellaceae bacterium]
MAPPNDTAAMTALMHPKIADGAATRPDPAALQPNIGAIMADVSRLMRRRFERRTRQTGLPITRQQARALLVIARDEGLSQAAVATMLDIEPIALVRLLDRLHEEGLVERRAHATDRRVRTLWLTSVAWQVVNRVLEINAEVREEACAGLPRAAREAVIRALSHMKENLIAGEEAEAAAAE